MLNRNRNIIFGVGFFVIFIFVVQLVFVKSIEIPDFTYPEYETRQQAFNTCYVGELEARQTTLRQYLETYQSAETSDDVGYSVLDLLAKNSCSVSFVSSNDGQVRVMAEQVLHEAYTYYQREDIKLLNAVYTSDEQFAAIMQTPRSYLFYALTPDESQITAFQVTPNKDNTYDITAMWDVEQSFDATYTGMQAEKLLLIYNEKVF